MPNIFKLHKYQTFGLLKMRNMSKIWFANNKISLWNDWFTTNGMSKMLIFNFCLFHFSKFQMTIVKNLMKKPSFFKISTEMYFVSLVFLNERNNTTSRSMMYVKCNVVHYANLNSSSINKPYLQAVEYGISLFSTSYSCFF